jgi:hypothetical protein
VSVGLSGNLQDFGLADVFQLIGQQRKTGILELTSKKSRIQVVFDRGSVVSAAPAGGRSGDPDPLGDMLVRCGLLTRERATQAEAACKASAQSFARVVSDRHWLREQEVGRVQDVLTKDTLFEVLRWANGSFDFRAQTVEHEREHASLLGAEQILMDGLRMTDEWRELARRVPSENTIFERFGRFESYAGSAGEESPARIEAARKLFGLIDGRLSVRRVIDLALVGNFEGMRTLTALQDAGLIKPLEGSSRRAAALRRAGERSLSGLDLLRHGAAALVPFAVLATAVLIAAQRPAPEARREISRSSLESLRAGHATRQLRAAIDTYRLLENRWPAGLDELAARGLVPASTLATPEGRPYYLAHRRDGLILLAPEH